MSFEPNYELARSRFVDRVANAFFLTWAGFGFVGRDFTYENARKLAQAIADRDFPLPGATGRIPARRETSGDEVSGD